jgi:hypothetical protein
LGYRVFPYLPPPLGEVATAGPKRGFPPRAAAGKTPGVCGRHPLYTKEGGDWMRLLFTLFRKEGGSKGRVFNPPQGLAPPKGGLGVGIPGVSLPASPFGGGGDRRAQERVPAPRGGW